MFCTLPLVSIIVPCYNVSKYVKRCLDSLVNQTYSNIEIICVDDFSTDGTYNILSQFSLNDERVKIFLNKENKGVAFSRQVGLDNASGKYIMWCDSDDWYELNMVEEMLRAMEENKVDLVISNINVIDDENLFRRKVESLVHYENLHLCGKVKLNKNIILNIPRFLWNKIFKKSIIDKYKITFPNVKLSEDCSFFLKYLAVSNLKIYILENKLYNYMRREDSIIGKRFLDVDHIYFSDSVKAYDDMVDFIDKYYFIRFKKVYKECRYWDILSILDLIQKSSKSELESVLDIYEKKKFN